MKKNKLCFENCYMIYSLRMIAFYIMLYALFFMPSGVFSQNGVSINTTGSPADNSAILDVTSPSKGLLIPRIALISNTDITTIQNPSISLLVYNTGTGGLTPAGFYYWDGTKWLQAIGPAGPTGVNGTNGVTGSTGAQGIQGVTGAAGTNGVTGPTGAQGVTGAAGTNGVTGPTGAQGVTGAAGTNGVTGPTGAQGIQGASGIAGTNGTNGVTGPTGANGTAGVTGPSWIISTDNFNSTGNLLIVPSTGSTVTSTNAAWLTTGNTGTTAGTNFIGTLDAQDVIIKTNGNASLNERMRVTSGGKIIVNNTAPAVDDVFSVYGTSTSGAINSLGGISIAGYSSLDNVGLLGDNSGTGFGVWGNSVTTGSGVMGSNNANGVGVFGINLGTGEGVLGSNNSSGFGVYGNNTGTGLGVLGKSTGAFGLEGITTLNSYLSSGILGKSTALLGTGSCGVGNNGASCLVSSSGSGLSGTGSYFGVYGTAISTATNTLKTGGYFASGSDGSGNPTFSNWSYVGAIDVANVTYKMQGPGTVSTVVKNLSDSLVVLSCPEAPEILFEDYGSGELNNGETHITIDPVFVKNTVVNEKHPLRAFVQIEGECNGVYITNKTAQGFDVKELNNGKSNVKFMWHIIANRANEKLHNGTIAPFAEQRFSKAIPPQKAGVLRVDEPKFVNTNLNKLNPARILKAE